MIWEYGNFKKEVHAITNCENATDLSEAYERASRRFLEPDGYGNVAIGCSTISAALRANDPIQQDLLAVSAASQLIGFEEEFGWAELLQILDFILGLDDSPYIGRRQSYTSSSLPLPDNERSGDAPKELGQNIGDGKAPIEEIYDFGIKVRWFPALVEMFSGQLEEIATKILDEVSSLGSETIYMHRFSFAEKQVMIATSWDDEQDILSADADLVSYQDAKGQIELDGDELPILQPVAASDGGALH